MRAQHDEIDIEIDVEMIRIVDYTKYMGLTIHTCSLFSSVIDSLDRKTLTKYTGKSLQLLVP